MNEYSQPGSKSEVEKGAEPSLSNMQKASVHICPDSQAASQPSGLQELSRYLESIPPFPAFTIKGLKLQAAYVAWMYTTAHGKHFEPRRL